MAAICLAAALLSSVAADTTTTALLSSVAADTSAAEALLVRALGPTAAKRFTLTLAPATICKSASPVNECVVLADTAPKSQAAISIQATSLSSLTFGIGVYLRTRCNATLSWSKVGGIASACTGLTAAALPSIGNTAATHSRSLKYSYYQNVVDSSYSFAWYDTERWYDEIDWMALNGVNLALVYTGQEKVLMDLYASFGIDLSGSNASSSTTGGARDYFSGPAFLSWSRGQSMAGVGSFDVYSSMNKSGSPRGGALPKWWIDQQAALGKSQALRMRALGITTILRGYENNVPVQLKEKFPDANISQISATSWALDALDPLFAKLSDAYMKLLLEQYGGSDHFYQADGFFNSKKGPWYEYAEEEEEERLPRPPCVFSSAINDTYLAGCADDERHSGLCASHPSLAAAEAACAKIPTCGGVTLQTTDGCHQQPTGVGCYSTRKATATTPSPTKEPSTSWLLTNAPACRAPPVPTPPPTIAPPDADAAAHSAAAYGGMARTDRDAVWVYQTWIWRGFTSSKHISYLQGWLSSIPKGKSVFLDQTAEWTPIWKFFNEWSFFGAEFIWCSMSSMGGNLGMFGAADIVADGPLEAIAQNTSIAGVGLDPEGINNNPAYFAYLLEGAWRTVKQNTSEWLQDWGARRCAGGAGAGGVHTASVAAAAGSAAASARAGWALLAETVYKNDAKQIYEHHMGYCPTTMPLGSGWNRQRGSERPTWYTRPMLHEAWGYLLDAAESGGCGTLSSNDAFTFDLVDVGREYLSIAPCNDAYDALLAATSSSSIRAANSSLGGVMADIDALLGTSRGFLLGTWIASARKLAMSEGGTASDADFLEWNARSQITSWDPTGSGNNVSSCAAMDATSLDGLWDYANKAWSGLVRGYYDARFFAYADAKLAALKSTAGASSTPDASKYHAAVMRLACEFALSKDDVPATPTGDVVALSRTLWRKYAKVF